jgi:transposase
MKQKQIVAIDVSKRSLDICLRPTGTTFKISNDLAGFKELTAAMDPDLEPLVVMEHTGYYSFKLEQFLQKQRLAYCKVPALEIKRSGGMVRGKADKIDSVRIAEYAWLRREQLAATAIIGENVIKLDQLLSLRAKLVKDCSGYKSRLKEMMATGICVKGDAIYKAQQAVLKTFTTEIKKVEAGIEQLIASHSDLKKNFDLVRTIKGVGKIVAAKVIAVTNNFKKFSNARKFNCYAGLAPFKHESGTSIRGRSRISHLANKEIKTVLSLAAFCAIRCDEELKKYYQKRVAEGKRKMSCLNIIRAKIVSRIFAVIKRQTPYVQQVLTA